MHVTRFGVQTDIQGVLAETKGADQCIGQLSKYQSMDGTGDAQRLHAQRVINALRWEPSSVGCENWLRYGVQPKNAKPGTEDR